MPTSKLTHYRPPTAWFRDFLVTRTISRLAQEPQVQFARMILGIKRTTLNRTPGRGFHLTRTRVQSKEQIMNYMRHSSQTPTQTQFEG